MKVQAFIKERLKEISQAVKGEDAEVADGIKLEIYIDENGDLIRSQEHKITLTVKQ